VKYAQPTVTLQQEALSCQIVPAMLDISKDQMLSVIYVWKVRGARTTHRLCVPPIKMQTKEALQFQTARAMKDSSQMSIPRVWASVKGAKCILSKNFKEIVRAFFVQKDLKREVSTVHQKRIANVFLGSMVLQEDLVLNVCVDPTAWEARLQYHVH